MNEHSSCRALENEQASFINMRLVDFEGSANNWSFSVASGVFAE